ncbi:MULTISPECIES: winged helix-turn-helix transcriptional regulator [Halorubrum]|uniref:Regulatory protein, arsR family n=1 Tax=Halorubrum sodomense TaxID=35743 RepID=A0A1I6H5Q0_HALSD|nr:MULTISPECIES: helix-turn-helix domain-containing protein [Halorubrum]TKX55714.1 winged helix-turn-helix transcriptional regulator [Halorubrum sp. SP3]TKX71502.1 winged helix-turn-helix transcriptional regulator [Halorubrum sp. SP9]SFR49732.1 regulatory protein, arsR family [Halorubrum sodomense]
MATTRDRVRRHVRETPGVHFNRVERDLDIATGQAQYHLRRLVNDEELVVERIAGRTHYFDPAFDPWERRALAFLRRETAREIVLRLHADGPLRPETLTTELDLARSTVSWHVSNLSDAGIVTKSDDRPMTITLARPDRTDELLEAVSPSLPDRLVDRFIRTVDSLFE